MKKILLSLFLFSSVSLFAQKTWVAGGGTGSGNWSTAANWSGGTVPTATDSVVISSAATNGGAVITIDANAVCGALYLIGGGTATGPLLQFASSGTISLTVSGGLSVTGGSSITGPPAVNTRPKLHSNGNTNASLILNASYSGAIYTTTSSNTVANNSTGLNMNEGNVTLAGSNAVNINGGAGFRLGNLQVGDGVNPKTVAYTQSGTGTITITGLTVKTGATFNLGGTTQSPNLGSNNVAGVSNWTNGLTIESGATLAIQPSTAANLCFFNILGGNIVNNGTLTLSATNRSCNVNLTNTTGLARTRTISGSSTITFSGLVINDTLGTINLNGSVAVNDSLTLNRGIVVPSVSGLLLNANCVVYNGSNLSYVKGGVINVWTTATATKKFPIGDNSFYRPLVISLTTPASPSISAMMTNGNPGGTFTGGIVSQNFYYKTSLMSGTATGGGTAQINFIPASDGVSNTATLGVGQATAAAGAYTNLGNSLNTATSVTSTSYNPASGDYIALVSTSGNTLPVSWKTFGASKTTDGNALRWSTASETNNSHFEVQRSVDGRSFETIGRVKGAGTSTRVSSYTFTDADTRTTSAKTTYYRLMQVDFDGKSSLSRVVSVIAESRTGLEASLPNPFNNALTVTFNSASASVATVTLMDMIGKVYFTATETLMAGANKVNIETTDMPNGIYFVRVEANGETFTQKVIKK